MSARRLPRPRLTYANVMSTVAAFIALGGTSYAVAKLPKDSVGTAQLRAGAVTSEKLASGVAISGPRGPRGAQGPTGAAGSNGANGSGGSTTGKLIVWTTSFSFPSGSNPSAVYAFTVPAGKWHLLATGSVIHGPNDWHRCFLPSTTGSQGFTSRGYTQVASETVPGISAADSFSIQSWLDLSVPTVVQIKCATEAGSTLSNPRAEGVVITATPVSSIEEGK